MDSYDSYHSYNVENHSSSFLSVVDEAINIIHEEVHWIVRVDNFLMRLNVVDSIM